MRMVYLLLKPMWMQGGKINVEANVSLSDGDYLRLGTSSLLTDNS
jgi:hypothetical protein